jgi:creatinine amidohydrolase
VKLIDLSSPQVAEIAAKTTAILPVAAIEQHGVHLAVSTDFALVTHIAERAEAALRDDIVLCPTLPFGASHHHLGFAGTMSLSHETFTHVVVQLVESLLQSGFRRIVVLNGHGGNITPAKQALSILSHRYDDTLQPNIALVTYWELGGAAFAGELPMESPALSHACEYETSMMLHISPERVSLQNAQRATWPPANKYVAWEEEQPYRGVSMSKRTHFISSLGSSGRPDLANAEKGEHLLRQATDATIAFLREFKEWPLLRDLRENNKNQTTS